MKIFRWSACFVIAFMLVVCVVGCGKKQEQSCDNDAKTSIQEETVVKEENGSEAAADTADEPSETKPGTDSNSSETNSIVERKPAEIEPVDETKPAEEKLVTEETLAPAAIPVVTAEEAEKLNEFALFLTGIKPTVVEGEIVERSELPNPQESDYPNCRFTVHFNGNSIKSGEPCPKELSLIVEGFENYRVLPNNNINTGDKIQCTIFPFDKLPEDYQSTQQADDLNLFALKNYYVLGVKKISSYADGDNVLFPASGVFFLNETQKHRSIYDRQINPPVPKELQEAQARAIAEDLKEINEMLKGYDRQRIDEINAAFLRDWEKEKEKHTSGYDMPLIDKTRVIWKRLDNSFFCINANPPSLIKTTTISDDNLKAIVALKNVLEANGVQLIVSIIQRRDPIVARIIAEDYRDIADYQTYDIVRKLLEHGVETITPSRESVLRYNEEAFVYNVGNDDHPSILIQKICSEILAKRLERYGLPKRLKKELFSFEDVDHVFYGSDPLETYPENCDIGSHRPGERIKVRMPTLPEGYSYENENSEVLVIGNSFLKSPYTLYGLVSWLTYHTETDCTMHVYINNGPGTVFINNLLLDPEKYLKGKKVAIIQITIRNILENNWHNIATLDRHLSLLSSAKPVSTIPVQQQEQVSLPVLSEVQKTAIALLKGDLFVINKEEIEISKTSIETNDKKKLVVIPASLISGNVSVLVNGESQIIPSSYDRARNSYQSLIFELPADTKNIVVSLKGSANSVCVIKDIELWQ